jgi:hypothetical protein
MQVSGFIHVSSQIPILGSLEGQSELYKEAKNLVLCRESIM